MRHVRNAWLAALVAVVCTGAVPAFGQDGAKKAADEKAMMEAWEKAGTPGEPHRFLGELAGNWTVGVKMWMDPSQPAMESTGSAEIKPILGGRFVQEDFKGDFMGQPFTGMGLTGYDNISNHYTATWADSMSTHMMTITGSYDPASKTFTYAGEIVDPIQGKKPWKSTVRIVSKDKHVAEMYDTTPDGKSFKSLELTYTRK